ncbi:hypothetical protein ACFQBU_00415 [Jhaorihella thermophila]
MPRLGRTEQSPTRFPDGRVQYRLSTICDWAKGAGDYPHENPVNGLKKVLPLVKRRVAHLPPRTGETSFPSWLVVAPGFGNRPRRAVPARPDEAATKPIRLAIRRLGKNGCNARE